MSKFKLLHGDEQIVSQRIQYSDEICFVGYSFKCLLDFVNVYDSKCNIFVRDHKSSHLVLSGFQIVKVNEKEFINLSIFHDLKPTNGHSYILGEDVIRSLRALSDSYMAINSFTKTEDILKLKMIHLSQDQKFISNVISITSNETHVPQFIDICLAAPQSISLNKEKALSII